jgi:hypothetical protein
MNESIDTAPTAELPDTAEPHNATRSTRRRRAARPIVDLVHRPQRQPCEDARRNAGAEMVSLLAGGSPDASSPDAVDEATEWFVSVMAELEGGPSDRAH